MILLPLLNDVFPGQMLRNNQKSNNNKNAIQNIDHIITEISGEN